MYTIHTHRYCSVSSDHLLCSMIQSVDMVVGSVTLMSVSTFSFCSSPLIHKLFFPIICPVLELRLESRHFNIRELIWFFHIFVYALAVSNISPPPSIWQERFSPILGAKSVFFFLILKNVKLDYQLKMQLFLSQKSKKNLNPNTALATFRNNKIIHVWFDIQEEEEKGTKPE